MVAPPFAVFEGWAPRTSPLRVRRYPRFGLPAFGRPARWRARLESDGSATLPPTQRKPRWVGQPRSWWCRERTKNQRVGQPPVSHEVLAPCSFFGKAGDPDAPPRITMPLTTPSLLSRASPSLKDELVCRNRLQQLGHFASWNNNSSAAQRYFLVQSQRQ